MALFKKLIKTRRVIAVAALAVSCAGSSGSSGTTGSSPLMAGMNSRDNNGETLPELDARLFLMGDAGNPWDGNPVLVAMSEMARATADQSTMLFLGDNLYPNGLDSIGSSRRRSDERRLRVFANIARRTGVRTVLMPGNHDWRDFDEGGWRAVVDQQSFIDGLSIETLSFLPKGGCPGPITLDLGTYLRVIIVDTSWWLYDGLKPGSGNSQCANTTQSDVLNAIDRALRSTGARRPVVAGHHPLNSGGPHGGYMGWKDHIFPLRRLLGWAWLPLPGVGSLYPLIRNLGVDAQDLGSRPYKAMTDSLERVFRRHDVVAYVGAHDHSLQVIRNPAVGVSLVSGAGPSSGLTPTAWVERSEFAKSAWGFMRLDVFRDQSVQLTAFAADDQWTVHQVFQRWLVAP